MKTQKHDLGTLIETDVLVIGSGASGCGAALGARDMGQDVVIIDKGKLESSGCIGGGNDHYMRHVDPEVVHELQYVLMPGDKATFGDWADCTHTDFQHKLLEVEIGELIFGGTIAVNDNFESTIYGIYTRAQKRLSPQAQALVNHLHKELISFTSLDSSDLWKEIRQESAGHKTKTSSKAIAQSKYRKKFRDD